MSDVPDELLPDAGWPRPHHADGPVPWVSPQGRLAVMEPARERAGATGAVCAPVDVPSNASELDVGVSSAA